MWNFHWNGFKRDRWPQYAAAIVMNLSAIYSGMMIGWPAPVGPKLRQNDTPVGTEPMTDDEISWLSSVAGFSAICVLPFYAWIVERFGRKITGCCMALPAIACWLFILFAQNFYHLLVSRLLTGLVHGICFSLVPVYVSEISDESNRGPLGSLLGLGINFGILITFIGGATLSYHQTAIFGTIVPVVYFVAFMYMPETPTYLMRKGDMKRATRSLMWLRNNDRTTVDSELRELEKDLMDLTDSSQSTRLRDLFRDRGTIKGFIICLGLFSGQQTSGCAVVMVYTVEIFAKSSKDPISAAIVVALIQIIASSLTPLVINHFRRRTFILVSCAGMAISHLVFGSFFVLHGQNYDGSSFSWIPLVALSTYSISYSMGLGPGAYVVAPEVLKPDVASHGISVCMVVTLIFNFITTKFFPVVVGKLGLHVSFFILALFCVATFVFTFFLMPETRGRSMGSIFEELNGKNSGKNGTIRDDESDGKSFQFQYTQKPFI